MLTPLDDPFLLYGDVFGICAWYFVAFGYSFFEIPDEVSLPTIAFLLLSSVLFSILFECHSCSFFARVALWCIGCLWIFHLQILTPALITSLKRGTRSAIVSAFSSVFVPLLDCLEALFVSAYFEKSFLKRQRKKIFLRGLAVAIYGLRLLWVSVGLESRTICVFLSYILGTLVALPLLPLKNTRQSRLFPLVPCWRRLHFFVFWGEEMLTLYLSLVWKGAL